MSHLNVRFQKISTSTPWMVTGNSEGLGVSKAKLVKGKYEAKLEFPPRGVEGFKLKSNHPWRDGGVRGYGYFLELYSGTHFCGHHTDTGTSIRLQSTLAHIKAYAAY